MRRQNILGFLTITACALLVGHGIAAAQAGGAPPVPDTNVGLSRQVNLSPAEQVQQADAFLSRMEGSRSTVRRQLETARTQRDVVKTLCLNDKLNQIDVAIRSARERKQSLEGAAKTANSDLATHEFTILSVLRQRTDQLALEANQCIGQDVGIIGESSINATIDPGIPDDPGWESPQNNVVVQPPSCASCVK